MAPDARGRGEGIYTLAFDPESGALEHIATTPDVPNPSFLALHPSGRFVYAANEMTEIDGHPGGAVSAFARDPETGALTFLNRQPSHGADPCHVSVDASGRVAFVANYTSGSVALLPIAEDGSLEPASVVHQHARRTGSGPNPKRQEGPHAHFITDDPANRFVLANDLGIDQTLVYRLDAASGALPANDPPFARLPEGAGPRHLAFHPAAPYVYVINELGSSVTACRWDATAGTLDPFQTISTLPDGFTGQNSCADIHVAPSGRFLYGSNRGHDSIAAFAIDASDGSLTPLGQTPTGGEEPRNFAIDPSGRYLLAANQNSDTIVTFALDPETGTLTATGHVISVPSPVCVVFGGVISNG
jgi:6-phosphogluconolactonase